MPIATLVQRVKESHWVLAFTGAGISAGLEIPEFRGPEGLWKRWQAV